MKNDKKKDSKIKKESCTELKNIKYQNMLLSNSKLTNDPITNISNMDHFLKQEIQLNTKKPWNKLGRTLKISLIKKFVVSYAEKNNLSEKNKKKLEEYLLICIDRKKLQKIKDIQYDIENNKILSIPLLYFNKQKEIFILKRSDKKHKISYHLAPKHIKKGKKTLKNSNKDDKKTNKGKTNKGKKEKVKKKVKKEKVKKEKVKKEKVKKEK